MKTQFRKQTSFIHTPYASPIFRLNILIIGILDFFNNKIIKIIQKYFKIHIHFNIFNIKKYSNKYEF